MTGGHDVPEDVIRYNFNEGLKNVIANLNLFENITFIDGNTNYGRIIAMHISKNNTHKIADDLPAWFQQQFREIFDE